MRSVLAPGRRFEFIDALRGFAALAVVLPHVVGLFVYSHETGLTRLFLRLADYGRSSVEVFFVVSGFAIAYSLRGRSSRFGLGRFMMRRAVRLDPPYWVAMIWSIAVGLLRERLTHQPFEAPSPASVLAHLFYVQDILGFVQINIVFWTLCLEFQLYLVFAALLRIANAWRDRWAQKSDRGSEERSSALVTKTGTDEAGWVMIACFAISLVLSHTVWPLRPGWFVPFFYLFLSGSLAAWLTIGRLSERLFVACVGLMGVALLLRPELARVLGFLTALVLYVAIRRDALHRWFSGAVLQWLGRLSYPIYLVHAPLAVFFLGLRTRISAESAWVSLACLALMYAATLVLAFAMHIGIELPCMRWSQQLRRGDPLDPASVQPAPHA